LMVFAAITNTMMRRTAPTIVESMVAPISGLRCYVVRG
jgi:hypothetical protein